MVNGGLLRNTHNFSQADPVFYKSTRTQNPDEQMPVTILDLEMERSGPDIVNQYSKCSEQVRFDIFLNMFCV